MLKAHVTEQFFFFFFGCGLFEPIRLLGSDVISRDQNEIFM